MKNIVASKLCLLKLWYNHIELICDKVIGPLGKVHWCPLGKDWLRHVLKLLSLCWYHMGSKRSIVKELKRETAFHSVLPSFSHIMLLLCCLGHFLIVCFLCSWRVQSSQQYSGKLTSVLKSASIYDALSLVEEKLLRTTTLFFLIMKAKGCEENSRK